MSIYCRGGLGGPGRGGLMTEGTRVAPHFAPGVEETCVLVTASKHHLTFGRISHPNFFDINSHRFLPPAPLRSDVDAAVWQRFTFRMAHLRAVLYAKSLPGILCLGILYFFILNLPGIFPDILSWYPGWTTRWHAGTSMVDTPLPSLYWYPRSTRKQAQPRRQITPGTSRYCLKDGEEIHISLIFDRICQRGEQVLFAYLRSLHTNCTSHCWTRRRRRKRKCGMRRGRKSCKLQSGWLEAFGRKVGACGAMRAEQHEWNMENERFQDLYWRVIWKHVYFPKLLTC